MATAFAQGKKLLAESKYEEAVSQFTLALQSSPTSPDYLLQRSTAYQRAKQYAQALEDAEQAIIHATNRAKRELIIQGQLRRGIAFFHQERYGDAQFCFKIVQSKDPKEKSVGMWLNKTEGRLKDIDAQSEKAVVNIREMPEARVADKKQEISPAKAELPKPSDTPTAADKIRHEWYQSSTTVSITLLARGVPKDKATIDIQPGSISISFPVQNSGSDYDFTIDPLFALVDVARSQYKILPARVEITLYKATAGQKWPALEGTIALETAVTAPPVITTGPTYPTSSKTGPKNWDQILDDEPGQDDDDIGGDDATKFFKKLYKDASAETQRAMMKSYIESNGTALSTNWDEVGKAPVETLPPDGMESKKWAR